MANALYDFGKEQILTGSLDFTEAGAQEYRLIIVDHADDVPDLANDQDLADRAAGARVAESANFASKTVTAGVFDAADITLSTITGDECESIDIFLETGTDGTSTLVCNIDTATGLPVTPNGGDIIIAWDSGANKIFAL